MIKRTELLFAVLLVPLDFCLLLAAGWLAYRSRFQAFVVDIRPVLYDVAPLEYFQSVAIVAAGWLAIFAMLGLYQRKATDPWWPEAGKVILACSAGLLAVTFVVFLRRELLSSRFIILAAWVFSVLLVTGGRLLIRLLQRSLFKIGIGAHRVAVVGSNAAADEVAATMKRRLGLGYLAVARLPAVVGSLGALQDLAKSDALDEVLLLDPGGEAEVRQAFLDFTEEHHLIFRYAPDLLRSPIGEVSVDLEFSVPIVEVPETTLRGWGRVIKRLIDIVGSALGLVLLSPFFLLVAIMIKVDSRGPIIYISKRLGRGYLFTLYKFRSMKFEYCVGPEYGGANAEKIYQGLITAQNARHGPVPKIANDPRVSRLGKWLRRFSLDELPQLYNVLKGDMSLVGPRPHYPHEVANYAKHHRKVLAIKPGLTGLAQINGRSDLDFEEEVRLDRYYIEHWSLWLDLRIISRTLITIFERRETL